MAQLLRADLLPEAWIAPPPIRQLRALLRHRVALVRLRTRLRNRIHAIVADHGHDRPRGGYWSGPGRAWLASLQLPAVSRELADDDLGLIDAIQARVDRLDGEIRQLARSDPRVKVLTQLPGVGPFTALVILAEAGDVGRFASARKLASWAGLTPTVRGSDRVVHYGHISKEGSVWLRWVLCAATQTAKRHPQFAATFQRIAKRRGKKIATTAVARKLVTRACTCSPTASGHSSPNLPEHPQPRPERRDRTRRGRQAPGELEDHPEPGSGPRSTN